MLKPSMADTEDFETPPNQQVRESNSTGAIIDCEVTKDKDSKCERMSAVRGLNAATKEQIHQVPALIGPPDIYADSRRSASIQNYVEAIGNEAANQRAKAWEEKFEKRQTETRKDLEEFKEKFRQDLEQRSQEFDAEMGKLQQSIKKLRESLAILQPLQPIVIGIRRRFLANYRISNTERSVDSDEETIETGNHNTDHGNIVTDSAMIKYGHMDNNLTFYELYGITHNTSKLYIGIYLLLSPAVLVCLLKDTRI